MGVRNFAGREAEESRSTRMAKRNLKKFVAKDAAKFSERVKYFWEESIDIALDQWDTFKKLPSRTQALIGGGAALLVVVVAVVLLVSRGPEELPVIAGYDQTGILGENFIALESESDEPLTGLTLVVDNAYIYRIDRLTPYQAVKISLGQFHHLAANLQEGATVTEAFKPQTMVVQAAEGTKSLELTKRQKGWFERLFGGK
jgi:hypothetical protein